MIGRELTIDLNMTDQINFCCFMLLSEQQCSTATVDVNSITSSSWVKCLPDLTVKF